MVGLEPVSVFAAAVNLQHNHQNQILMHFVDYPKDADPYPPGTIKAFQLKTCARIRIVSERSSIAFSIRFLFGDPTFSGHGERRTKIQTELHLPAALSSSRRLSKNSLASIPPFSCQSLRASSSSPVVPQRRVPFPIARSTERARLPLLPRSNQWTRLPHLWFPHRESSSSKGLSFSSCTPSEP